MVDVSQPGRPSIRLTLPTLGAISSIASVVVFVFGFVLGYSTFKAEMTALKQSVADFKESNAVLRDRMDVMNRTIGDDRQGLTNRLSVLESDIKYITQGVAELKLAVVPKR